jgi:hypothetical protein
MMNCGVLFEVRAEFLSSIYKSLIQYNTTHYNTIQYSTIQHVSFHSSGPCTDDCQNKDYDYGN